MNNDTPIALSRKEFWKLYLKIKTNNLTTKEIDIVAEHWAGAPKPLKGNYKAYVQKIRDKGIPLTNQSTPKEITLQINININD